ncbi:cysteine proteinase [Pseudovirgaria hyperparasitica]|uniref:ubiquitinyl hydrolase 1 n=1 Tax=Pseudovirgaria hyperparasitica TaxID=470096 RepID=A0A6A6VXN1_9PEZI|nr:cysteine proteinase [Pseudovirgaria hyperparasitica]KAF2754027.1 cysteine proteinase [Pseudovirgaria hyperparasitica]
MDQLGSDMLIDSEFEEKHDVAIISQDDPDAMEDIEAEPILRADDFDAMKERYLPDLPDQEAEDEAIHTWDITNWRQMGRKEHGPVFQCAGSPWRILFFPSGNNVDSASFYLEQGFEDKPPEDWYACVQFLLVLWNPNDPTMHVTHTATHRFTVDEGDWGFTRFAELRKLFASSWEDKPRPMVENDSAKVTAYVRVLKDPTGVLWHNFLNYDSKKETGLVGLKNQGATCYLNSLLQSLYFTNAFRKAIYQIPTEQEADRSNSAYALQRLFYQLQSSAQPVPTNELTQSFGWDSKQIFEQQDVQELSRILMERMEEKMKGTEAQDALSKMFLGKMKTYISCINVPYESSRTEDFWDVQLNVSGNKNLDDSFKDYVQVETMDGENKYFAEGHGLQDAKKGVIFESFPQVLHLQLKRFEYDINRDAMMKVNDRYEFPEFWDASPYLSETADRSEPYIYHLHGVLVHSGDLNAGHYYAFLKPDKNGEFYKFDDDRVTRATKREAMEENFGGDYPTNTANNQQRNPYTRTWSSKRSMSAYMLVYIRESRLDDILLPNQEVTVPPHLAQRIAEERIAAERRKKEREEAHLYMDLHVATKKNFTAYQGFDIVPWTKESGTPAFPKHYRVLRSTLLTEFLKLVAEDIEADPNLLRPWAMVNRQNGTVRPDQPITISSFTVEEAANKFGSKTPHFRIWVESTKELDSEGNPIFGEVQSDVIQQQPGNKPIMLFLKHFDAEEQTLFGVGTFYAGQHTKVQDLSPQILEMMNWPAGTTFKLFEEIKQSMIEPIKPKATLHASEIQDGDIITIQKTLPEKDITELTASGKFVEVREFYDYLLNRCDVTFTPKPPTDDESSSFMLTLSKKMNYDQFAAKVGIHLGVDPTHIRFTTINPTTNRPKVQIKRTPNMTLGGILFPTAYGGYASSTAPKNDQLFYEVLELSLAELESRKLLKISWLSDGISKVDDYEVLVPKNGTISDLLEGLQKKINLPDDSIRKCRIFQTQSNKLIKPMPLDQDIAGINEFFVLYAERIPDEELADENPRLMSAFHFDKDPAKPHSIPFTFVLKEGEVFKDTKERLSKRTGIKGKNLDKIKFSLIQRPAYSKPQLLNDEDVITNLIGDRDDVALGLDHVNKQRSLWGKADSIFIR